MKPIRHALLFCMFAAPGITSDTARASVVYETATSGPTGQASGGGVGVGDDFITACNFQLTQTTDIGSIGGHSWPAFPARSMPAS